MSRGFPSMTALLGLLAIAGYQNRDKLAEMLSGLGQNKPGAAGQGGLGGLLGQLRSSLGGASPGGILSGGLGELVDRFKQSGHGETADSWVGTGPHKPVTPSQLCVGHLVETNGFIARRFAGPTFSRAPRRR